MAVAAVLGVTASFPQAAVIDSGTVNIAIPNTLAGVYINWVSGVTSPAGAAVPGWDFNPYAIGNGALLDVFAPNGGSEAVVGTVATTAVTALPVGTTIDGASTFVQGVASGVNLRDTATHYVGIRFLNEDTGAINFGYAQVQTTAPGGFPATIVRYVYENTGAPMVTPGGPPLVQSLASRRIHGAAGTFDLPLSLSLAQPTIEPRQGPSQSVVFTFNNAIVGATATVTEGAAVAAAPAIDSFTVTVDLTGVTDGQYVTVTLTNIADSLGGSGATASARLGFLFGDVNGSRVVTLADVGQVNEQLAQPVTSANHLMDLDASGTLSLTDKALANSSQTHSLPAP